MSSAKHEKERAKEAAKQRPLPESLCLPCVGVDSHAHLDSEQLWPDFIPVLEHAAKAGLSHIGQVFLNHAAYLDKRELMGMPRAGLPELFFLLGIHPCDGLSITEEELSNIEEDFRHDPQLRAVGEIGLDFYWKECPREVQENLFRLQLRMAARLDRPVVIHSRDAFTETLRILDEEGFSGRPLLWHCFGGDDEAAREILKRGWHISLPGPLTYPANHALRDAAALIPEDRLMVETDCPYLAPVPWRGKRNEPALSAFTAAVAADMRGCSPAELWKLCGDNARRFFGIG
ncbi:MAG TPA: TatD family hydrolase [Candidatus Mailhella merdavium]|nr:TatD family hydrolase [Candidatus Mailhella merdavium]